MHFKIKQLPNNQLVKFKKSFAVKKYSLAQNKIEFLFNTQYTINQLNTTYKHA